MSNLLGRRFAELSAQAVQIEASKKAEYVALHDEHRLNVDANAVLGWKVKAKSLLEKACGTDSPHLKHFEKAEHPSWGTTLDASLAMTAVFEAAKEDFDGGYFVSARTLAQADVFVSELEQARELLGNKYATPAAVVAGAVLETSLRELCDRNGIQHDRLDKMNTELSKAGIYNGIVAARIRHLAAIRNSAAHGSKNEFEQYDVAGMIDEIERFLAQHFQQH